MLYQIFSDKLAFPFRLYPILPDGTYENLQMTYENQDYSIHQVALLNIHKFVDLIEKVRLDPTVRNIYSPSGQVAHVVAYDPKTLDLCFDPLSPDPFYLGGIWT
jgi:hypothetical protein